MIEPADFFVVADALVPEGDEALDRSAVSRMYYGTHHQARRWLAARGRMPRRFGSVHRDVVDAVEFDPAAADALDALRGLRVRADYELTAEWSQDKRSEAHDLVHDVHRALRLL